MAQLVKESACNVGDLGLILGLGRSHSSIASYFRDILRGRKQPPKKLCLETNCKHIQGRDHILFASLIFHPLFCTVIHI